MNARWIILSCTFALFLSAVAIGPAQVPVPPGEKEKKTPGTDKQPPPVLQPLEDKMKKDSGVQDPTYPGPIFEKILNQKNLKGGTAPKLPNIVLRGRVVSQGKAAALLEVDGKLVLVNQKSVLSMGGNVTLKIVELNITEIRIEISPLNEIMVLR